jgi:hypothetical protein
LDLFERQGIAGRYLDRHLCARTFLLGLFRRPHHQTTFCPKRILHDWPRLIADALHLGFHFARNARYQVCELDRHLR